MPWKVGGIGSVSEEMPVAPIFLGGNRTLVGDLGVRSLAGALRVGSPVWGRSGGEIRLSGTLAGIPTARRRAGAL